MSIQYQVLGEPGRDNSLIVTLDSGQSVHHLLFDCGEGCLSQLPDWQVGDIEAVFFSHFHMDHVAGFDSLFRSNWAREGKPVRVFGPPGTIDIIHHRMRGYIWNLSGDSPGEWIVSEIDADEVRGARFLAAEGFAHRHAVAPVAPAAVGPGSTVYAGRCFDVGAIALDHGTPSMAYTVREHDHSNVDPQQMEALGLAAGPWLKELKDPATPADAPIDVAGVSHPAAELRAQLIDTTHGDSIAYLTDFMLKPGSDDEDRLVHFLRGCQVLVCENNYRDFDAGLAAKHHHMTSAEVAEVALRVDPQKLVLFHLSDRYTEEDWHAQLAEVRERFDRAEFPDGWLAQGRG